MKYVLALLLGTFLMGTHGSRADESAETVRYKRETVDGVSVFYREAGDKSRPAIVLLHGFPSSSHMFRDLIPRLAAHFYVIAPDYPGFGYSDMPSPEKFDYNFDHLSEVMEKFLKQVHVTRFFVYMQDYGGPVGFRIAVRNPSSIRGLVIQNANAYEEGISDQLRALLKPLWDNRNAKTESQAHKMFELENTKYQYQQGARDKDAMNPDAWTLDQALMDRPGNKLIQLELQAIYKTNPPRYPEWHRYFQKEQPPTLVVWGKGDPIFTEQGALAYKKDLKNIEIHLYNTGHFALEEEAPAIAERMIEFVNREAK
jgi:pimeloyl-ACP methyl ester carboxylesterase